MRLCRNGFNTADNFNELASLLLWNLKGWNENAIRAIRAVPSNGILANNEGPAHAKVSLITERDNAEGKAIFPLQNKIFALAESRFIFADLCLDFYIYPSGIIQDHDFTLFDTVSFLTSNSHEVEETIHDHLDNLEWLFLSRGHVTFGFGSSLFLKDKNEAFLATLAPAIQVRSNGKTKLLKIKVSFTYPSVECII